MAKKFLVPIDLAQSELRNAVIQNLGADVGSPLNGQIWYLTTGSHDMRARVNGATVSLLPTSLLSSANTWTSTNVFNGAVTGNNTINLTGSGASSVGGTFAAIAHISSGLTGATAASRYVGATASGAPASGPFVVGDYVIDQTGTIWVCTVAGSPGTWKRVGDYLLGTANTWSAANTFSGGLVANSAITGSGTVNLTGTGASSVAGTLAATAHVASGLTGATAASRYVGATASGSPASGPFVVGDFVIAQNGHIFVCTVAGSPGTWVDVAVAGSLTLGSTVVSETSYGQASSAGSGSTASKVDHTHGTPTHIGTDHAAISLSSLSAPTADLSIGSHKLTNVTDPTGPQDAATKNYVDSVSTGLDVKTSVRAASTGAIAGATYTATGGASARGQFTTMPNTLDGVSLAAGNRALVKDQVTSAQNGIYVVTTLGTGANGVWDRATDFDTDAEVTAGAFTFVTEGTANADSGWVLTTNDPITIGGASGTALAWAQFSGAGQITAGAGLTKTGNTLDVGAGTGISVAADSVGIDTAVVARKFTQQIGNGALTSIGVTHSLGNQWVNVQVFSTSAPFDEQECDIQLTDANTVTLLFTTAPASNALRVVVTG